MFNRLRSETAFVLLFMNVSLSAKSLSEIYFRVRMVASSPVKHTVQPRELSPLNSILDKIKAAATAAAAAKRPGNSYEASVIRDTPRHPAAAQALRSPQAHQGPGASLPPASASASGDRGPGARSAPIGRP